MYQNLKVSESENDKASKLKMLHDIFLIHIKTALSTRLEDAMPDKRTETKRYFGHVKCIQ